MLWFTIRKLKTKDWKVRKIAIEELRKSGNPRALEPLISALADSHTEVASAAAKALGEIANPKAIQPLAKTLGSGNIGIRKAATDALGAIGDSQAIEPLAKALCDSSPVVREAASKALQQIDKQWYASEGASKALPLLIKSFSSIPPDEVEKVVGTLDCIAINWRQSAQAHSQIPVLVRQLLTKDLKSSSRREAAAIALGKIGHKNGAEALIAALKDEKLAVRELAARSLGEIGDGRAIEPLLLSFASGVGKEEYLARIDPKWFESDDAHGAAPKLIAESWDSRWSDRIAEVLVKIKDSSPASLEGLVSKLGKTDLAEKVLDATHPDWRRSEVVCKAIPGFVSRLESTYMKKISFAVAAKALGVIGDPQAIEPLIKSLKSPFSGVEVALVKFGQTAVGPLAKVLQDASSDPIARRKCAALLGKIGGLQAVASLVAALKNPDELFELQQQCAKALDNVGWQPESDDTASAYFIAKGDWEKCAEIGKSSIGPLLGKLTEGNRSHVIASAAETLCTINAAEVVQPLVGLLMNDRMPLSIKSRCCEALERQGWHPQEVSTKAQYLVAKEDWEGCLQTGLQATRPLVLALNDSLKEAENLRSKIKSLEKEGDKYFDYDDWVYDPEHDRRQEAYDGYGKFKKSVIMPWEKKLEAAIQRVDKIVQTLEGFSGLSYGKDLTSWQRWLSEQG